MGYLKTKGIVIKEVNTGEADKIVTIFSKSQGKLSGFAKGAKRPKSKFVAGTQFLCYSDFILFKGRDMYTVNSCDVIEPFYELRNDIVKLTYSAHFAEIINDTVQENQPATKVLQLFLNTLYLLSKSDKPPELLTRIFELRLLSILGYAPYARGCMECGKEDFNNIYFSFLKCGLLCGECMAKDQFSMKISPGTARAINHIIHSRMNDLFNFNLSPGSLYELDRISKRYLKDRLEKDYNKLDYLKTLGI